MESEEEINSINNIRKLVIKNSQFKKDDKKEMLEIIEGAKEMQNED